METKANQDVKESNQHEANELTILPFVNFGYPEALAFILQSAFDSITKENRAFTALKFQKIETLQDFIEYCIDPDNVVSFVCDGSQIVGMGWANNHRAGGVAFCHIIVAAGQKARSYEIGRKLINYYFCLRNEQGDKVYNYLISKSTPGQKNVRAYAAKLGFVRSGFLPGFSDNGEDAYYMLLKNDTAQ
jgi:ribosomal protein S18 acetylase RimI-like enzyme